MSEPFVAEIKLFPYTFAPRAWAICNGQLMPISQNTALFALLGTMYGGDGKVTFALPNLNGSVALGVGEGPGLSPRFQGEMAGSDTVTLLQSEMPTHAHALQARAAAPQTADPDNTMLAQGTWTQGSQRGVVHQYVGDGTGRQVTMNPLALLPAGSSLPHNNMMPFLKMGYYIALQGVFPSRN